MFSVSLKIALNPFGGSFWLLELPGEAKAPTNRAIA